MRNLDSPSKEYIYELREGFKNFLKKYYTHLSHHEIICSEAFYPLRQNVGIALAEIIRSKEGLERYRELLETHFVDIKRKNSKSDSYTYCRAISLLKEYVDDGSEESRNELERHDGIKPKIQGKKRVQNISRPCCKIIQSYAERWNSLDNYRQQEEALNKLFINVYSLNNDMNDVLIKVSVLNGFYSTNIFSPFRIAKHIIELQIDERLQRGDISLVNDIASVEMSNGSSFNFYSFATKYCSHHKPQEFPIYDYYVDIVLRYFRDADGFCSFNKTDLKEYYLFKEILLKFRSFYNLQIYTLKDIDRYLWQLGKEYFPRKIYKRK